MSLADATAAHTAYKAARAAGDWTAAVDALIDLQVAHAALPESKLGEFEVNFGSAAAITAAIKACRQQQAAALVSAGGIARNDVAYQAETDLAD